MHVIKTIELDANNDLHIRISHQNVGVQKNWGNIPSHLAKREGIEKIKVEEKKRKNKARRKRKGRRYNSVMITAH